MCDYSLYHVASRPAVVGEKLVTNTFPSTVTRGFSSTTDPNTAVCVRPGTEISFAKPVELAQTIPFLAVVDGARQLIGVSSKSMGLTATFIQVDKQSETKHHDALQFPDGSIVLLTQLEPGQQATVLTLPVDPATLEGKARANAETDQARAAFV